MASIADVRDYDAVKSSLDAGVAQLGHLDIVSANAGIESFAPAEQLTDEQFTDMLQVNRELQQAGYSAAEVPSDLDHIA